MSWTKVAQVQSADVNVLLNATFDTSHHHAPARDWLMRARSDSQGLGLFSSVLVSYLRISTDRRVFDEPLLMADAQRFIEALLASPHVRVINPGPRQWELFCDLVASLQPTSRDITDTALAAAAIEVNAVWASFDRGFARYPSLRWVHPGDTA
jgi:uncharacterized protein